MAKSKEEIFAKGKEKKEIKLFKRVEPDLYKHIMNAMDEYARQEAIEFAEWISGEGWENYDGYDRWILLKNSKNVVSTSQLYQLFITSITK